MRKAKRITCANCMVVLWLIAGVIAVIGHVTTILQWLVS